MRETTEQESCRGEPASGDGGYRASNRDGLLELMLTADEEPRRIDGVVVGHLTGFDAAGSPLVYFRPHGGGEPLPARSATALKETHVGREVALLFEEGDPRKPVVMGLMWNSEETPPALGGEPIADRTVTLRADGQRITFTAEKEIVLRCGESSITLTRAGKILIRGKYLLSRSSGVNRIKGGSVQIN